MGVWISTGPAWGMAWWEPKDNVAFERVPHEVQVLLGLCLPEISGLRNPNSHVAKGVITQAAMFID